MKLVTDSQELPLFNWSWYSIKFYLTNKWAFLLKCYLLHILWFFHSCSSLSHIHAQTHTHILYNMLLSFSVICVCLSHTHSHSFSLSNMFVRAWRKTSSCMEIVAVNGFWQPCNGLFTVISQWSIHHCLGPIFLSVHAIIVWTT